MKKTTKDLILILGLTLMGFISKAQDDSGVTPYTGTVHNYSVNASYDAAVSSNTFTWQVFSSDGTTPALAETYSFLDILDGTTPLVNVTDVEDLVGVAIQWNTAGDYIVEVAETNQHCTTRRRINVSVSTNDFNVTIAANDANGCNSADGNYILDDNSNLGTTTRSFLIKMTTDGTDDPAWKPEWVFNYSVTIANGATPAVTFSNGAEESGKVTVPAGTLETTMVVVFDNALGADQDVTAALTFIRETDQNTPDPDEDIINSASVSVFALPATTTIITD